MQSRGRQRSSFMSSLGGGGGRQQSQRRGGGCDSHWRRPPAAPSAGRSSLPAFCGGPWVTFAVLGHCSLPPYPPIRVALNAMRRSPDPPGPSFPTNPTPPCHAPWPSHRFGCKGTKRAFRRRKHQQTPLIHQGSKDKEGICNILYHSLSFACIYAGTHLSCPSRRNGFCSRPFGAALGVFHSLVLSSTARRSSLVALTVEGHSSACVVSWSTTDAS
jgi:hypothetical protein